MPGSVIETIKKWIAQITELGLLLIALAIVLQILIGGNLAFFDDVVGNLTALIAALGDGGLVGLIAIGIIMWLFAKRRPG